MPQLDDNFAWSFTKLASYLECPYAFYLKYVVRKEDDVEMENAFGQYGTLGHKLLEMWAKGELREEDMAARWDELYPHYVTASFPPFPKDQPLKSFQAGLKYFSTFHGFGDIDIMEVETKFTTNIGPYLFRGIADLVYRDNATGGVVIMDHKSKSENSMKKEYKLYKKQLYLYAKHVHDVWGIFPSILKFNMFKAGTMIDIPFDKDEYDESLAWAEDVIDTAFMEDEWPAHVSSYRCSFICDARAECDAKEDTRR